MKMTMVIQGREITHDDIESVRRLVKANPSWKRPRLSKELCVLCNWRAANGQMKDMACRAFLLKLEQCGYITLPTSQKSPDNSLRNRSIPYVSHQRAAITGRLDTLPLFFVAV
jgi:hypothetical protein